MKFKLHRSFLPACCLLALVACAQPEEPQSAAPEEGTTAAPPAAPAEGAFNTTVTLREIMDVLIDPHADALWDAVRWEIDADGERAWLPETEEDWAALRASAVTLLEGANALMIPGRRAAPAGAVADDPQFEYSPEEIDGRIQAGWSAWVASTRAMQSAAVQILDAIDAQDIDRLFERNSILYDSCEGCHRRYWYRQ